jgi:hypothetical protein
VDVIFRKNRDQYNLIMSEEQNPLFDPSNVTEEEVVLGVANIFTGEQAATFEPLPMTAPISAWADEQVDLSRQETESSSTVQQHSDPPPPPPRVTKYLRSSSHSGASRARKILGRAASSDPTPASATQKEGLRQIVDRITAMEARIEALEAKVEGALTSIGSLAGAENDDHANLNERLRALEAVVARGVPAQPVVRPLAQSDVSQATASPAASVSRSSAPIAKKKKKGF